MTARLCRETFLKLKKAARCLDYFWYTKGAPSRKPTNHETRSFIVLFLRLVSVYIYKIEVLGLDHGCTSKYLFAHVYRFAMRDLFYRPLLFDFLLNYDNRYLSNDIFYLYFIIDIILFLFISEKLHSIVFHTVSRMDSNKQIEKY